MTMDGAGVPRVSGAEAEAGTTVAREVIGARVVPDAVDVLNAQTGPVAQAVPDGIDVLDAQSGPVAQAVRTAEGAPGVPESSVDLYRGTVEFAASAPHWVQVAAEVGTDAGLLVFGSLFLLTWWRARRSGTSAMALALLAPAAMVLAYVCSEALKSLLREERPCRAVADAAGALAECPAPGDWSFPSNHATLVAAAAVALVIAWRRLAPLVLPLAVLMGASRVFVGVHYPHDVLVGMLLGAAVAAPVTLLAVSPVGALLIRAQKISVLRPLITTDTGAITGRPGRSSRSARSPRWGD